MNDRSHDVSFLDVPVAGAHDLAAAEDSLAQLLGTTQSVLVLQGEAILALEATARGLGRPGLRALNVVTGPYGTVFGDWLRVAGADVHDLTTPFDTVVTAAAVTEELQGAQWDLVSIVHAEAATGGSNPLDDIAQLVSASGALLVVDAVASVGAQPVSPDRWGADVVAFGPQKALAGPAGSSAVVVSERAWAAIEGNPSAPRNSYLSLLDLKHGWLDRGRTTLPGYVSTLELLGLQQALDRVHDEGIDAVVERHRGAATRSRAALRDLDLEPWIAADEDAAAVVTSFAPPQGVGVDEFAAALRAAGSSLTGVAPGPLAAQVMRVNHTGRAADPAVVAAELDRVADAVQAVRARRTVA